MQQSTYSNFDTAFEFITYTDKNVFITGKAGTGKTTFLHRLKRECPKQMAVIAPTGVAAINACGSTIHSFFLLPFSPFIPTPEGRKDLVGKVKLNSERLRRMQELELLVIDEVSMVRADIIDCIDTLLRHARHRSREPFGGVQMIFIGDMFQLSPVAKRAEQEILSEYYQSLYFFDSKVLENNPPVYLEFTKVYRQNDDTFIEILNEIRMGKASAKAQEILASRYQPDFECAEDNFHIILTTHNYKADEINTREMEKIENESFYFDAKVEGDFPENSFPADKTLELKEGARVMFIKNDAEHRYFNGKTGIISHLDENRIVVKCGDEDIEVSPQVWHNTNFKVNKETTEIVEEILGTFTQYPFRLAWAITIHKSQGLTFDRVIIDPEDAFAAGQAYVALSRCCTLEGIVFKSILQNNALRNEQKILHFTENGYRSLDTLPEKLQTSKQSYLISLWKNLFNFDSAKAAASQLYNDILKDEPIFVDSSVVYAKTAVDRISEISEVGNKFGMQLTNMYENNAEQDKIATRLREATAYFVAQITPFLQFLSESPVATDNKAIAEGIDKNWNFIYTILFQKRFWMSELDGSLEVDKFFNLRKSFSLQLPKVTAYAPNKENFSEKNTENADLFKQLLRWRTRVANQEDVPHFRILHNKVMHGLVEKLPRTKTHLKAIKGIGKATIENYGDEILEIIHAYLAENGQLNSTHIEETPPKKKKNKGDSARMSYELYRKGKFIDEIADERELSPSTIATHLGAYVLNGKIEISDVIPFDKLDIAELRMAEKSEETSTYQAISEVLSSTEIILYMAYRNKLNQ